jgi:hypothetical protein
MDSDHLGALLNLAGTEKEGEWSVLKDERSLTLHAAEACVGMNVSKIRKVRTEGSLLFAENLQGDIYVLLLSNVFAGSVDPPNKAARKAGFR